MSGTAVAVIAGMAIGVAAGPATAQTPRDAQERVASGRVRRQPPAPVRNQFDQLRYQIGTMERVLENAVEHGASVWRDRLQALAPVQALLLDNARVRGYRLEDYGMFFDIDVPSLETTLFSAFRTLDQNGLGVQSALEPAEGVRAVAGGRRRQPPAGAEAHRASGRAGRAGRAGARGAGRPDERGIGGRRR